jgi:hypothetical protein
VERNAGLPPDRRIEFRVGVHLGDVVEESDGDLMGDGVNIAARLEGFLGRARIRREEAIFFCPRGAQAAEKQRRYEKNRSSVIFRHRKSVSRAQMSAILRTEILEPRRLRVAHRVLDVLVWPR